MEDDDLTYEYLLSLDSQPVVGLVLALSTARGERRRDQKSDGWWWLTSLPRREKSHERSVEPLRKRARSKAKKKATTRSESPADEKDAVDDRRVDQAPGGGAADRAGEECDEVCDDEDACVICLEDFVPGERLHRLRSCKCTKVLLYHRECLEKWLKADPSCPQCRSRAI